MQLTKLQYLEDMHALWGSAKVLEAGEQDGRQFVVLDQTILYAQGGGQPADHGSMKSGTVEFVVTDVRFKDGVVYHFGEYHDLDSGSGAGMTSFAVGDAVKIIVDAERRQLHKRLHSGAHVLDMVVAEMNLSWTPGKGYHFPDGPYVEYAGSLDGVNVDELKVAMEARCNEIIAQDASTSTKFVSIEELAQLCRHVPENLPAGKPTRVVLYGDFGVPCGGTHVAHLGEIGHETIRKIKVEKGNIKVGYDIDRI
jgi:Ser-tRNA(Ala) deacylase AlaX